MGPSPKFRYLCPGCFPEKPDVQGAHSNSGNTNRPNTLGLFLDVQQLIGLVLCHWPGQKQTNEVMIGHHLVLLSAISVAGVFYEAYKSRLCKFVFHHTMKND